MTVRRGRDWGDVGPLPKNGVVVATAAELRGLVSEIRRAGGELPPVGLLEGDLCRTLGGRGDAALFVCLCMCCCFCFCVLICDSFRRFL